MRSLAKFVVVVALALVAVAAPIAPVTETALAAPSDVEISEFMASNNSTLLDEDGASSDWVELHNTSASPVDLNGWHLTDSAGNLLKWTFPSVTIDPDAYLIVFASLKNQTTGELHTGYKLSAAGEYLGLIEQMEQRLPPSTHRCTQRKQPTSLTGSPQEAGSPTSPIRRQRQPTAQAMAAAWTHRCSRSREVFTTPRSI